MEAGSTAEPVYTMQMNPAQVYQDANARLKNFILNQHNIMHRLAPYNIKQNSLANISGIFLKFTPIRILFLDEVQQAITVSCFMMVKWYDNSFTWDPLQFGNITDTFIKSTKLWTPTIILPTSTGHGLYLDTTDDLQVSPKQEPGRAILSMKFPFQFTVQCEFDMSKYPFDQQTCVIIFRELNQNPLSAVTSKETDFEMAKALHTSGEWEIVDWYHLKRSVEEPFTLRWKIRLRRQSQFYVANLLIPLVQTSLMTLLVFWIPAESGEKMSFVVSMFVSTSVFLFTINDEMPRSIRHLPTINILVVVVTSEIILVAMASLFVLRRCRYLQKIQSANTSLKFASELGRGPRNAEADRREIPANLSIHQTVKHLSPTESIPEFAKTVFEGLTGPQNGSSNKAFAARIDMSDSSAKTTFKLNLSEIDKNQFNNRSSELYNHETLDLIFFCVFAFINVIVGIVTYFSWF
ncbi:unnamed protein product [Candidula unifasciata]|uniref:Uncharacterized protein n=1 Tax=Candidula unifasciata TaxID=100452 RepID=A0A8S3ZD49_9EUPU|nr:unnamed protein product [Candidula unifasciata]